MVELESLKDRVRKFSHEIDDVGEESENEEENKNDWEDAELGQ